MFGRLFGGGGGKPASGSKGGGGGGQTAKPDMSSSIQTVRGAIQQLEKKETLLEKRIQECVTKAKQKSKRKDKKGALFELKKKKQLENQLNSLQGKRLNLETQINAMEDAQMNKETIAVLYCVPVLYSNNPLHFVCHNAYTYTK